ncbi:hypothetical protein [Desulfonatronovibrio hydrogenovorans]|uniref:hypothetical protein n=1 Tax=Desulfonatronovibrio hydrogenovorans TaxID=53245 RepID=UPI000490D6EE|nr:hypothetical protein [Desulfonatronovibrio hydrogenovorans]
MLNIKKALILTALSWAVLPLSAPAYSQDTGCRINDQLYQAHLESTVLEGYANKPVNITVLLDPAARPAGYFVVTNIRLIQGPASVDTIPGFPDIKVTCPLPGEYELEITTSFISRSSCGGVKACSLHAQTVRLFIQ